MSGCLIFLVILLLVSWGIISLALTIAAKLVALGFAAAKLIALIVAAVLIINIFFVILLFMSGRKWR